MSVLHARIVANGGQGRHVAAAAGMHPYGTGGTVMVMPIADIDYQPYVGVYQDLYPSPPATGDPNAVPYSAVTGRPGLRTQPPRGPVGYDVERARYTVAGAATADPNHVPVAMIAPSSNAPVIPAGRP